MTTQLYRSRTDAMIGGVCAGLARSLNVDPTLVRIVAVLLALSDGIGVLLYLLLWLIVPQEPVDYVVADRERRSADQVAQGVGAIGRQVSTALHRTNPQAGLLIGGMLIVIGAIQIADRLDVAWLRWAQFDTLWPLLLVAGGIALIMRRSRGG